MSDPRQTLDILASGQPEAPLRTGRRPIRFSTLGPIAVLGGLLGALAILIGGGHPRPYDEQLIHIQAERTLAPIDPRVMNEPADLQALLLAYGSTGDRVLQLKAWIALDTYPGMAPDILAHYGTAPEFQAILRRYGEAIIPVIHYFRVNDVFTLQAQQTIGNTIQRTTESARKLWDNLSGKDDSQVPAAASSKPVENTPDNRGWYAIRQIAVDGHDLLGQFVIATNGQVSRIQTKRVTQDIGNFLTGGIANLERKSDTGTALTAGDYVNAATDAVFFAAAFKLLRAGRTVATAEKEATAAGKGARAVNQAALRTSAAGGTARMSLMQRTRIFGAALLPRTPFLARLGSWGAVIATGYVILRHPSLINSLLAGLAHTLGIAPGIVQFVGWWLILGLLLFLVSGLLNVVWRPVRLGLHLARGTRRVLVAVFVRRRRIAATPTDDRPE